MKASSHTKAPEILGISLNTNVTYTVIQYSGTVLLRLINPSWHYRHSG
jgi:hypothetical protein